MVSHCRDSLWTRVRTIKFLYFHMYLSTQTCAGIRKLKGIDGAHKNRVGEADFGLRFWCIWRRNDYMQLPACKISSTFRHLVSL
jgi:hypothetical protein